MQMNSFNVDTRITMPVQFKTSIKGTPVATLSVANNSYGRTNFFDCVAFNKTATYLHNYAHKGQKLGITGRLEQNNYNGQQAYTLVINNCDLNRDNGHQFTDNHKFN